VFLTALSPDARKRTTAIFSTAIPSKVWQIISTPFAAWLIHSVVIWLWHAPRFFQATLTREFVHALQHVSFFGSAWLFCWSVLHHPDRSVHSRKAYMLAVVYIFGLAMHTSILSALLTFSTSSWYPVYTETMRWGLTPVDDQQLGGLLMWIPGGIAYTIAGLACALKWLRHTGEEPTVTSAKDGRAYPIERGVALELTRQSVVPILLLAIACFAGCEAKRRADIAHDMTGGSAQRGRMMLKSYGCSSCHTIPGVPGAAGLVGPPLSGVSKRTFIAGIMENNVGNLLEWIKDPPKHDSLTVMPNLHVSDNDARDIAAYLYTLR
jgi:putative membrane protein